MSRVDIKIKQGKTFSRTLRWSTGVPSYANISTITNSAPVSITSASHGIPDGWMVALSSIKGMKELNIDPSQPMLSDYKKCKVIDANTIVIPEVNSLSYKPYTGSGTIIFMTPVDLSSMTGIFTIKDTLGGTVAFTTALTIDNIAKTLIFEIPAGTTSALTISSGVYEVEASTAGGVVTQLMHGTIKVEQEVIS